MAITLSPYLKSLPLAHMGNLGPPFGGRLQATKAIKQTKLPACKIKRVRPYFYAFIAWVCILAVCITALVLPPPSGLGTWGVYALGGRGLA